MNYTFYKNEENENDLNLTFYLYNMINNNIDSNYDPYEDIPYDNTNRFTCLCPQIIKNII